MRVLWRRVWEGFWSRAPRRLKITGSGKVVVGIAVAIGFAAINTGNNLLFLGWGMMLSAIVLSGVLSEATLRVTKVVAEPLGEARVGQVLGVPIVVCNRSRHLPAFGLEVEAMVRGPGGSRTVPGPFELRLSAEERRPGRARFVPEHRGRHEVGELVAHTAYPFGFFDKDRRFSLSPPRAVWVAPRRVDVEGLAGALLARVGEESSHRVGFGEDFFSLRPFREGDDPRRVHWRRTARTGRRVVVETEAQASRQVVLELPLGSVTARAPATAEHAIAVLGSLAEDLLERGLRVGVRGPGCFVAPAAGPRQRAAILLSLAQMDAGAELARAHLDALTTRVLLRVPGAPTVGDADWIIDVPAPPASADDARDGKRPAA